MFHTIVKYSAALVLIGCAIPATASDGAGVVKVAREVSLAGLDLSSDAGVTMLDRRIARAVSEVCGRADGREVVVASLARKCRAQARIESDAQVRLAVARAKDAKYAGDPAKVAAVSSIRVAAR
jgi:UrcA family protein